MAWKSDPKRHGLTKRNLKTNSGFTESEPSKQRIIPFSLRGPKARLGASKVTKPVKKEKWEMTKNEAIKEALKDLDPYKVVTVHTVAPPGSFSKSMYLDFTVKYILENINDMDISEILEPTDRSIHYYWDVRHAQEIQKAVLEGKKVPDKVIKEFHAIQLLVERIKERNKKEKSWEEMRDEAKERFTEFLATKNLKVNKTNTKKYSKGKFLTEYTKWLGFKGSAPVQTALETDVLEDILTIDDYRRELAKLESESEQIYEKRMEITPGRVGVGRKTDYEKSLDWIANEKRELKRKIEELEGKEIEPKESKEIKEKPPKPTKPEKVTKLAKEFYQMSFRDMELEFKKEMGYEATEEMGLRKLHRASVEEALKEGVTVPNEVLEEYPYLSHKYGKEIVRPKGAKHDPDIEKFLKKKGYDPSEMTESRVRNTLITMLQDGKGIPVSVMEKNPLLKHYGMIHLQGVGQQRAKLGYDFEIGDKMMWNYGGTSIVIGKQKTSAQYYTYLIKEEDGSIYERKIKADRLVGDAGKVDDPKKAIYREDRKTGKMVRNVPEYEIHKESTIKAIQSWANKGFEVPYQYMSEHSQFYDEMRKGIKTQHKPIPKKFTRLSPHEYMRQPDVLAKDLGDSFTNLRFAHWRKGRLNRIYLNPVKGRANYGFIDLYGNIAYLTEEGRKVINPADLKKSLKDLLGSDYEVR